MTLSYRLDTPRDFMTGSSRRRTTLALTDRYQPDRDFARISRPSVVVAAHGLGAGRRAGVGGGDVVTRPGWCECASAGFGQGVGPAVWLLAEVPVERPARPWPGL